MLKVQTLNGTMRLPHDGLAGYRMIREELESLCGEGKPLRLAFTSMDRDAWNYEVECLSDDSGELPPMHDPLAFRARRYGRTDRFNVVMLIPTGIDCAIG